MRLTRSVPGKGLDIQIGFLFISSVTGYALAYIYLVAMGRMLGPEAFGILSALHAIFYITCVVGQALRQAIATIVAEVKVKQGEQAAIGLFIRQGFKLSLLCLIPCILMLITLRWVADFFHMESTGPVIILAFSLFTALVLDIILGLQQGLQNFKNLGVTGYLVNQAIKLIAGILLVWLGWHLSGAVAALLLSTGIASIVGIILQSQHLAGGIHHKYSGRAHIRPILVPTIILAFFLAMPTSIDVMLVTHFFGGEEAGLYAAVATLGKVVVFLPMAVSFVLLPRATENHYLGQGTRDLLIKSLLITLFLSGVVVIACISLPGLIIRVFFSEVYLGGQAIIGLYAVAMLFFSLNVVLMHYSLAVRNLWLMLLADAITLAQIVAMLFWHDSVEQVIWIIFWGNLLILAISLPVLFKARLR